MNHRRSEAARPWNETGPWAWIGSRAGLFLLTGLVLHGCGGDASHGSAIIAPSSARTPGPAPCVDPPRLPEPEVVFQGLETPWDLEEAPDGRLFLTERGGAIRVLDPDDGSIRTWATVDVDSGGELGLLGLALDPRFEVNGALYVMGRYVVPSEGVRPEALRPVVRRLRRLFRAGDEGTRHELRIDRYVERDGQGVHEATVVRGLPARDLHGGGALAFAEAGSLLYSVGDALIPWRSQDRRSALGKILRRPVSGAREGGRPPVPDGLAALGVRNSQGIAVHEGTGVVFFIDHGPSGLPDEEGRTGADELNVLVDGGNYGWPVVAGAVPVSGFVEPIVEWTPAIAPAGIAVHPDHGPDGELVVWVTGLRGQALHRLEVLPGSGLTGWSVRCETRYFEHEAGRFRAVTVARDGTLWLATSNRDGRGTVRDGDDQILRVRPMGVVP